MLVADVEGDGDLDLFIGGRLVPGRYPEPADSRLFRNEQGRLVEDQAAAAAWRGLGLVNAACFSDLDADGLPELVLACEWGALRVFQNLRGGFQDATDRWGLGASLGLWTSVQSGDFDGDGRMDLVAGNWGLNTHHRRFAKGPWYLYAGDFNGDGQVQTLEAALDTISAQVVPIRGLEQVSAALPWVRGRFETHEAYARAGVKEVLGDRLARARELRATTLASTLFLNRGDHFEAHPLPREAQWTTAWGLVVGDFNGDCREDLFVGQNCFAVRTEDDREAAGRGLLLMGDGQGGFKPLAGTESGIAVYGEQRGAATADYDGDGRPDLVVTQNAGLTRLFRNRGGVGGLRVRLEGPPSNPAGIGCAIRLVLGSRLGPAREVHGGGGYLSQDGAVSVLGAGEVPTQIQVRWPGGRSTLTRVPPGAKEVRVPAPE